MDFDNFTPIENTDLLSNLESSKGITVFIPNEYSPVLAKYPQFSNHEVSSFLRQLWSESSTYKKKSAESSYKRKRLDTNHENNGGELTEK
ncbi:45079_t:CDS:2, partial [Gigaspora margarita]